MPVGTETVFVESTRHLITAAIYLLVAIGLVALMVFFSDWRTLGETRADKEKGEYEDQ